MRELPDNTTVEGFEDPQKPNPVMEEESPEQEPEVESAQEEETTTLSDEERLQFKTLLTIGQTTKEVDVLGHPVVMRTMTVSDELMVGLETEKYRNTEAFARAYQSAVVAASVVSLDGKPVYTPLSSEESDSEIFAKKLKKIHSLYPIVVSEIYRHYMEVEKEFAQLAQKLGKL